MSQRTRREYQRRISEAMDFISRNLAENPSLEEIARAASFSKYHFHRVFRTMVGETVAEFTRRLRLERAARELVADPERDVTAIALASGFSSSQNFAKAFRRHFGLSATEYRQQCRESSNPGNMPGNGGDAPAFLDWQSQAPLSHERKHLMDIEIKDLPARHVAYVRNIGPYGQEGASRAFGALMAWAGPRGLAYPGPMLGVCWDDPEITPAEKCRYDAAVVVPEGTATEGAVSTQELAGGPHVVGRCSIKEDGFQGAWDEVFQWLSGSGHQPADGPAYELYLNDGTKDPEGLWQLEICVPVKPL